MKQDLVLVRVCEPRSYLSEDLVVTFISVVKPGGIDEIYGAVFEEVAWVDING